MKKSHIFLKAHHIPGRTGKEKRGKIFLRLQFFRFIA